MTTVNNTIIAYLEETRGVDLESSHHGKKISHIYIVMVANWTYCGIIL